MTDVKFEFEQNENVAIAENAPAKFRPSEIAWIISWRVIEKATQEKTTGFPIGTILYLVEYMDGSSIETPEEFLRHR